ncbi:MAG: YdcF family protein [Peptococcaceae bacterium]|nr:YdcF family protein [Peptococcaceae bacterium]
MKKFSKGLILVLAIWFCIHTIVIVIDGLHDQLEKSDVAIVLGNKVESDGQPSKRLQSRLDKAVELYNQKYYSNLIVSGGFGKEGYDEAKVMKEYLIINGIPSDSIITDSMGENTQMTAENSKLIMDSKNLETAMVITQYYHITRCKLILHKVGIKNVCSAHADIFELRDIYSLLREFFAYYQYVLIR